MNLETIIFIAAGVTTSLIAGLLFAFVIAVNLGIGKLTDREYLSAMQSINKEIVNPVFILCFMGSFFLLPATVFLFRDDADRFAILLVASLVYLIGQFGITFSRNIPLNNQLEAFKIEEASEVELKDMRQKYEAPWEKWNLIRSIASIVTIILILQAALAGE